MKFTCLQENLVKGLSTVGKAVSLKGSLPVLSNVLISSDNGRLKLSATNLETAITTWIGASIDREGAVTIPARILSEFVSNLPPSSIVGEVEGNILKLSCEKALSKFNGLDASEFPDLPVFTEDSHLNIDSKLFGEAVLEAAFAAAVDESRPVLTGVLVNASKDGLYMVSVDGFRLAEKIVSLNGKNLKKPFLAVIPAKTLLEVARLVGSLKDPLEISLSEEGNLVIFKVGDVLITSRTIDGDFPEYKKLIPEKDKGTTVVKLPAKDFVNALRLSNVFAKEASSVVRIKVDSSENAVFVLSSNSEVGENNSKVSAEVSGKDMEVAFNSKFIMDVFNNVKSDEFVFSLPEKIGPGVPGVFKPSERDDHTYLVMPMQF
ncbi:DNA polymerase III subunit beta [candidate division WWE3 bacterium RIFCSPHIGHO2_01_FULL_40_23]|uniref:Beta sliding clamp n=1 Tax=candidate division WWE3 bacterium RIFCSPLOWO2_01_FULL_41_18 TaxID=1802625 RepID=A0A1F4VF86_UNCKA|nr:MAG: DNA polymerase III subunit beta [candidate division WWE3 bacterium RIFCSPHIGHO2_01_FULL_40_23]OGC55921.1 MAG: DNA polymerase III subunit beta [candidate division WWE3 bacterium RIFCSPLOWO2_01_FULL_41_18]